MITSFIIAACLACALVACWWYSAVGLWIERRAHARTRAALAESEEYRDAVKRSALRGSPLVKWHRNLADGIPSGAEMWYWRIRTASGDILLSDEQLKVARNRAAGLLQQPETAAQKADTYA